MRDAILSELTLVAAFDAKYIKRLRQSWPTWMRYRPWLREIPALLIYDATVDLGAFDLSFLDDHSAITFVPWRMAAATTQRERMLNSLVRVPAMQVQTTWYLKLDADTFATRTSQWLDDRWFQQTFDAGPPAYVASPWGYTKPADAIARLDDWGDQVEELRAFPRLNLPVVEGSSLVRHSRMISRVFFGNTAWTRRVASFAPQRLPCPSQDTYLWYCAARMRSPTKLVPMKRFGWAHASGLSTLTKACSEVLTKRK
jgi:hypothetical protein